MAKKAYDVLLRFWVISLNIEESRDTHYLSHPLIGKLTVE